MKIGMVNNAPGDILTILMKWIISRLILRVECFQEILF
jgi:hypothetical protein